MNYLWFDRADCNMKHHPDVDEENEEESEYTSQKI
jgi:hypothetical protein